MYQNNMEAIIEVVPIFMSNVKLIYQIARFYNTPDNMTRLLYKVANQIIAKCKEEITDPNPKLWEQDRPKLLENLKTAVRLAETFRQVPPAAGHSTLLRRLCQLVSSIGGA